MPYEDAKRYAYVGLGIFTVVRFELDAFPMRYTVTSRMIVKPIRTLYRINSATIQPHLILLTFALLLVKQGF